MDLAKIARCDYCRKFVFAAQEVSSGRCAKCAKFVQVHEIQRRNRLRTLAKRKALGNAGKFNSW